VHNLDIPMLNLGHNTIQGKDSKIEPRLSHAVTIQFNLYELALA